MQNQPKYDLYIGKVQALPNNVKYSYYSSKGQYILLYSEIKPNIGDYRLVSEELYIKLQPDEKKWLSTTKMAINTEYLKRNAEKFIDVLDEFTKTLEKELKTEKENFEKVKNGEKEERTTT